MTDNYHNTEINVQINGCGVRVHGSEEFVERKFHELAEIYLACSASGLVVADKKKYSPTSITIGGRDISELYSVNSETGRISIHGTVPGNSKSERIKNVALITLLCIDSDDPVSNVIIRDACIDQACLDSSNFSTIFKKDKSNFIVSGKGAEWTIKLTVFGKQKAQEVLEGMFNE